MTFLYLLAIAFKCTYRFLLFYLLTYIYINDQNAILKCNHYVLKLHIQRHFFFLKLSSIEDLLMSIGFHLVPSSVLSNAFPKCLHYITVLQAVDSRYLFLQVFDATWQNWVSFLPQFNHICRRMWLLLSQWVVSYKLMVTILSMILHNVWILAALKCYHFPRICQSLLPWDALLDM